MTNRFLHEDEIEAAYESAENVLLVKLSQMQLPSSYLKSVARDVADAVIRSSPIEYADISSIPGITVERVGSDG